SQLPVCQFDLCRFGSHTRSIPKCAKNHPCGASGIPLALPGHSGALFLLQSVLVSDRPDEFVQSKKWLLTLRESTRGSFDTRGCYRAGGLSLSTTAIMSAAFSLTS